MANNFPHSHVDDLALGDFAVISHHEGEEAARARFPKIAAELATGCIICARTLNELSVSVKEPVDDLPPPSEWSIEGQRRLFAALHLLLLEDHEVDPGTLGEYSQVLHEQGEQAARETFPDVATHLDEGCKQCQEDVPEIIEILKHIPD